MTYWGQNALYHNNGDGTFTDVSEKAGLKTARDEWNTGCSFVDYDRDGKADLFVVALCGFRVTIRVPRPGRRGPGAIGRVSDVLCGPRGLEAGGQRALSQQRRWHFHRCLAEVGNSEYLGLLTASPR